MIAKEDIARWNRTRHWDDYIQVEQDMWLERLILQISHHPFLGDRIAISGGTGLHKLWFPTPMRYSEDLDYVCLIGEGRDMIKHISEPALDCGLKSRPGPMSWKLRASYPKAFFVFRSEMDNQEHKIKVEISTPPDWMPLSQQHSEYLKREYNENWLLNTSTVLSMTPTYMAAQKLQALYSRSKGRDLFDFYHLVSELGVTPGSLVDLVESAKLNDKRLQKWTAKTGMSTMSEHTQPNTRFMVDLDEMIKGWSETPEFQRALDLYEHFISTIHDTLVERKEERKRLDRMRDSGFLHSNLNERTAKYDTSRARSLKQQGYTNAAIAQTMGVSVSWVQQHTDGIKSGRKRKR